MRYDFEKLEVYQKALDYCEHIFELTEHFPSRVQSSLGDQLRRASLSICNNIAEGAQRQGASKRQFYTYSLSSARECVPMLELSRRRGLLNVDDHKGLDGRCHSIASMLGALLRSVR